MLEEEWSVLKLKKQTRLLKLQWISNEPLSTKPLSRRMLVVAILGAPGRWQQLSLSVCQDCCFLFSIPNRLTAKLRTGEVRVKWRNFQGQASHVVSGLRKEACKRHSFLAFQSLWADHMQHINVTLLPRLSPN